MSGKDYTEGGLVYGDNVTVVIAFNECILGRDKVCRRRDEVHRTDLRMSDRFWVCPLNDAQPEIMDERKPGEAFCADCPDHEACATAYPCSLVKRVARAAALAHPSTDPDG